MKSIKYSTPNASFIVEFYSDNEIHAVYLEADTFMTHNLIDLLHPNVIADIEKVVIDANRPTIFS